MNDLTVLRSDELDLDVWELDSLGESRDFADVTEALESLEGSTSIITHLSELAEGLAGFDWRTANAPGLSDQEETLRLTFRGSGGYSQLTLAVLRHLAESDGPLAAVAADASAARES
jgi:hypothetical protein